MLCCAIQLQDWNVVTSSQIAGAVMDVQTILTFSTNRHSSLTFADLLYERDKWFIM